jgi:hypothetical protein
MKKRTRIALNLANAWRDIVENDYPRGVINSEHSLQARFFARLSAYLDEDERKIFVEPHVQLKPAVIPDLIICSVDEIVAVVELKYKPVAQNIDAAKEDLISLRAIASQVELVIEIKRFLGVVEHERKYRLSPNTLFAWAGIHRGSTRQSEIWSRDKSFQNHWFLELHATTFADSTPVLTCNTNAFERRPARYVSNLP